MYIDEGQEQLLHKLDMAANKKYLGLGKFASATHMTVHLSLKMFSQMLDLTLMKVTKNPQKKNLN